MIGKRAVGLVDRGGIGAAEVQSAGAAHGAIDEALGLDDRALINQFVSLGDDPEFAAIQRQFDAAPSALRWDARGADAIALALQNRLDGESLPDGMRRALHENAGAREALLAELRSATKVFLYRADTPIADHELVPLYKAMRSYGHTNLLVARSADRRNPPGSVRIVAPGLLIGYLDATPKIEIWLQICRRAYALREKPLTGDSLTIRHGDHLFVRGDSNQVNEQHTGSVSIPDADRAGWLRVVEERQARLGGIGGFLFVLAPDKQTVYRHLLPANYRFRQAAFLAELPCVIDVAPALAAMAKFVDVYPRTDSHWNHLGALTVIATILARQGRNLPDIVEAWVEQDYPGDLGNKLTPPESSVRLVAKLRSESSLLYDNCVPNNGRIRVWTKPLSACSERPTRMLLFGDSYSYDLVHFLKELFDIVVHVHAFAVDYRIAGAFVPDLVVCEITERFVARLPRPGDGEPLTGLWQEKVYRREALAEERDVVERDPAVFPGEALAIAQVAEQLFAPYRSALQTRPPASPPGDKHLPPATQAVE